MDLKTERIINEINQRAWSQPKILSFYGPPDRLLKPEIEIVKTIEDEIRGKRILDIGIGKGRTVPFLLEISPNYVGIDYSLEMVKHCQKKYPGIEFHCCDARDLSLFKGRGFDFIFYSYNGIDYVSHSDRLKTLKEIYRLLIKEGYFAFSSHNKEIYNFGRFPFDWPSLSINPIESLKRIGRLGIRCWNHFKNKQHDFHLREYSIINDSGVNYSLLTYYISLEEQIRQLIQTGFTEPVRVFNDEGKENGDISKSTWIYYLIKK